MSSNGIASKFARTREADMTTIRLIDTSGTISAIWVENIRKQINIGDRIIMFDTEPHGDKVMRSQHDIDNFQLYGGGGTLINSTLELIERTDPEATIYCYTDGYFADGFGYKSEAIQNSRPFKNQRFKIIFFTEKTNGA
jgi:predicted metal-dependent peptidase